MFQSEALCDIASGTLGGLAQIASGHPFDTVKVNLQERGSETRFRGAVDCVRKLVAAEGLGGLYKGAAAPVASAVVQNAAIFASYGEARRFFARRDGVAMAGSSSSSECEDARLPLSTTARAAAVAGFSLAFVEGPVELVKCKVQVRRAAAETAAATGGAGAARAAPGSLAVARQIVREHGLRGLTQGLGATALRSTQAKVLYFVSYEWATRALAPGAATPADVPLRSCFAAGGFAGAMAWCAGPVYPTDVIKTRLQLDHSDPARRRYRGFADCLRQTVREEGWGALYKGFAPCLARAILVNACIFTAFTAGTRRFSTPSIEAQ
jgi:solute carrier family 25 carnitine/acylcarnitine transporter 20/29